MLFTLEVKIDEQEQGAGLASTLREVADMFEDRDPVSICAGKIDEANFRVGHQSPRQALKELAECVSAGDPRVGDLVKKALKISRFE
jgi:hypothetical protein